MKRSEYLQLLARVDELTDRQKEELLSALGGQSEAAASVATVEQGVGEDRRCPHCDTPGARSHGKTRGLQRYRCKSCDRTFNAVSGTPLCGLHRKERWLVFGRSLARGETLRVAAERCGIDPSTAFRWRHRFLKAVAETPEKLKGIIEADETYLLRSHKGSRNLGRPPRKRGGTASKPGVSSEQVPVLIAADRTGTTHSRVLPNVSAEALSGSLAPWVAHDALLVSDGHRSYPPCAEALGIRHEAVNLAQSRVRGPLHIQTVNSRHSQLKGFLRRFRGVSTRHLDNYLRWFHLAVLARQPTPRSCLVAAIAKPSTQLAI